MILLPFAQAVTALGVRGMEDGGWWDEVMWGWGWGDGKRASQLHVHFFKRAKYNALEFSLKG